MDEISITFAKIAGLKQSFDSIHYGGGRTNSSQVGHLLRSFKNLTEKLKMLLPELYDDLEDINLNPSMGKNTNGYQIYEKFEIDPVVNSINYILEVRANYRIGERKDEVEKKESIFLSHGRSVEWYKVQAYLERDLGYKTIELAQQPNLGRTVLQKLDEESNKCSVAIIVMTGDDLLEEGEIRARENVLHEIGFFQGKFGLNKIILLHEESVNIPSNIHGLAYIPFPTNMVETTLGALIRELKVLLT